MVFDKKANDDAIKLVKDLATDHGLLIKDLANEDLMNFNQLINNFTDDYNNNPGKISEDILDFSITIFANYLGNYLIEHHPNYLWDYIHQNTIGIVADGEIVDLYKIVKETITKKTSLLIAIAKYI